MQVLLLSWVDPCNPCLYYNISLPLSMSFSFLLPNKLMFVIPCFFLLPLFGFLSTLSSFLWCSCDPLFHLHVDFFLYFSISFRFPALPTPHDLLPFFFFSSFPPLCQRINFCRGHGPHPLFYCHTHIHRHILCHNANRNPTMAPKRTHTNLLPRTHSLTSVWSGDWDWPFHRFPLLEKLTFKLPQP